MRPYESIISCKNILEYSDSKFGELMTSCLTTYRSDTDKTSYNQAKDLLSRQNIQVPDYPSVNCDDLSVDNFCKDPYAMVTECKNISSNASLSGYQNLLENCARTNAEQTNIDSYNRAKVWMSSQGIRIPELASIDCNDTSLRSVCADPYKYVTECKPGENTDKELNDYVKSIKNCMVLYKDQTNVDSYNKAREVLSQQQIEINPVIPPDINCLDQSNRSFCLDPVNYLDYCGSYTNMDVDKFVDKMKFCNNDSTAPKHPPYNTSPSPATGKLYPGVQYDYYNDQLTYETTADLLKQKKDIDLPPFVNPQSCNGCRLQ